MMSNPLDLPRIQAVQKTDLFGLILLLCGIFILSLAAIFIRLSENEIGPYATIFNRFWIGGLSLILWKTITTVRHRLIHGFPMKAETYTRKDIRLGIACGVISASCLLSWAWSLTQTSVANSNLLHNLTPVFATLGGWLFFRNSFDNRFLIGLIFALAGTTIIGLGDLQVSPDNFRGDAVALLSAVFYGGSLLVREKFRDKFPVVTVLLWICGVGSIVALSVTFFTEDRLFPYSLNGWLSC